MSWKLSFITERDFTELVRANIRKYGDKLESFDLKKFNKNIVDPVKLIFDKTVYRTTWEQTIGNEIFRQRDKANNNDIGYFHQRIFQFMPNCHVPPNGEEGGWDVIYENLDGVVVAGDTTVHKVYVEMKNKHNTMNSAAAGKTFIKMQNQLLKDDECACFLVEAIAKKSQDMKWETTVDRQKVSHKLIRRVSLDRFYAFVTGQEDAFYQVCMILPDIIYKVVSEEGDSLVPHDSVLDELRILAEGTGISDKDLAFSMAIYLLGFSSYAGFRDMISPEAKARLKSEDRLSEYVELLINRDKK